MKTTRNYLILASFFAGLFLSGCNKEPVGTGSSILFEASSESEDTRTVYASATASSGNQLINWKANDEMSILEYASSATYRSDYRVSTRANGTNYDRATITPSTAGNDLEWKTGTHDFYAVYPKVASESFSTSALTCSIPATTSTSTITETTDKVVTPDLSSAFMFAKNTGVAKSSSSVNLPFYPLFTAYQFTIQNTTSAAISVTEIKLQSAAAALCGNFTINPSATDLASYSSPTLTVTGTSFTAGTTNDKITATFSGGVSVAANGSVTVTFIALPIAGQQLSLYVTAGDETRHLDLKTTASGTPWATFSARKRHVIPTIEWNAASLKFVAIGTDITWKNNY